MTAAGAAVTLEDGTITAARVGLTAVNADAAELAAVADALVGRPPTEEVFAEAGRRAAQACEPVTDMRGSAEYKRHLAGELTIRTLHAAAAASARGTLNHATDPEGHSHAGDHDGQRRSESPPKWSRGCCSCISCGISCG